MCTPELMTHQLEEIKKAQREDLDNSVANVLAEEAKRDKFEKELEVQANAVMELINKLDGQQQELETIRSRSRRANAQETGSPKAGSDEPQHPLKDLIMQQLVDFSENRSKKRSL